MIGDRSSISLIRLGCSRHASWGAYLGQLGHDEGVAEIAEVVQHRFASLDANDPLVIDARDELANCLMDAGRIEERR